MSGADEWSPWWQTDWLTEQPTTIGFCDAQIYLLLQWNTIPQEPRVGDRFLLICDPKKLRLFLQFLFKKANSKIAVKPGPGRYGTIPNFLYALFCDAEIPKKTLHFSRPKCIYGDEFTGGRINCSQPDASSPPSANRERKALQTPTRPQNPFIILPVIQS